MLAPPRATIRAPLAIAALLALLCGGGGGGSSSGPLQARASSVLTRSIDELDLQQQQHPNQYHQRHQETPNDVYAIKEGADLDLVCPIVVKSEDMIISWTCDNEPANTRSSRIHVTDSGKLRIHSSKVGDSCNYRCEAADGHGALSVVIRVIVVDQRLVDQLTRKAHLAAGDLAFHHSSSLRTVNETTAAATANKRRVIVGASPQQQHGGLRGQTANTPQVVGAMRQELGEESEIEMSIEPAEVDVTRNKTFSLECRIKHTAAQQQQQQQPLVAPPQIIWLKEYMGARVASIKEAVDKNLIYLDGHYYHSLNWPRAITYSNKSSSVSSALLVRHATYVHSGRYVCFAGYPASVASLDHNNSLLSARADIVAESATPQAPSGAPIRAPLKYKMAQALVRVDDKQGEASHRESLKWMARTGGGVGRVQRSEDPVGASASVLMSVVATNSWQRNATALLLILCGCLVLAKFILVVRQRALKDSPPPHVTMIDEADADAGEDDREGQDSPGPPQPRPTPRGTQAARAKVAASSARARSESLLLPDSMRDRLSGDAPANSLAAGNNPLREEYQIDQELLQERLSGIDSSNNYHNNNDQHEHLYSEIAQGGGVTFDAVDNSNVTVPKAVVEPYYKRPNKRI